MNQARASEGQVKKLNIINRRTAEILFEIGAIGIDTDNPFQFSSGIISPIYCDARLLMGYPEKLNEIMGFMSDLIKINSLEFDVVAGIATSSIHLAALLSGKMCMPMIYIRKEEKHHGRRKRIEGRLLPGQTVLIVEDVIATGGTVLSAVDEIRKQGNNVAACLGIFTYKTAESLKGFADSNCRLITLTDFETLIKVGIEKDKITGKQKGTLLEWRKNLVKRGENAIQNT